MIKSTKTVTKKIALKGICVDAEGKFYDEGTEIDLVKMLQTGFGEYPFDLTVSEKEESELDLETAQNDTDEDDEFTKH